MQLILVSGLSGAGKSIALDVLEDGGYYCVDNLPATLLLDVAAFLASAGHERSAVSVDARSAALAALPESVAQLKAKGIDCRVLYLEANTQTLMRRFSETRRRHPLTIVGLALDEAIAKERALLADVAALGHRIDTSELQPRVLRQWIRDLLGLGAGSLTLLFESFAFRDGIPLDADWVVDARMLPNPHYEPALRPLTGRDAAVSAFLDGQPSVQRLLGDVRDFLGRWLPEIVKENRSYLTVAIGCTGGRHRSVYLAERLAAAFAGDWRVLVRHRGLARE
ncbi:MAG: RNase adapter RapZ [Betaproteobacteria bacterium]|nr:RNase adapter RapZ [Betaproteobacteria bacterium]MDH5219852.1 RNase adapter RapZ [Betaproteobacteria bacterium]MDH5349304.1 RNase adapter RapZ [Betaproteobacteria bacterium]